MSSWDTTSINRRNVGRWLKNRIDVKAGCTSKRMNKKGQGRKLSYSTILDEEILQCLMERREQELAISILMLQAHPRAKIITPINPSFKASDGWAHKFMKRHKLVLRARTSMAQKLPGDLENRIVSFYSSLRKMRLSNDFPVQFIGYMDETMVYFDTVPGKTLHTCGAKTIKVRTTGTEKRHLTVVLSCTALGEVLP